MKFVFFLLIFEFSVPHAQASVPNACAANTVNVTDWSQISDSVLTCLNASSDFSSGIALLCQADKLQLSRQFSQYLAYQRKYKDILAWYQGLPLSRQLEATAINKKRNAMQDWELLGQKYEIEIPLYKVKRAYSACNPQ